MDEFLDEESKEKDKIIINLKIMLEGREKNKPKELQEMRLVSHL